MKLVVTEKAIAGKRIASILADGSVSASGEMRAPLFSFSRKGEEFEVVPLKGHIVDVDFPKKFSYWVGTDLKRLASTEVDYVGKEKQIISLLKKKASEADEIIVATDSDREGEAIGVEALRFLTEKNRKIPVKRANFSAITPQDIEQAFERLGKVDYHFADSADARREIDLIWGAVLTRFLSLVSGRLGREYLSVGRVQSPTLAIIVDREKERLAFNEKKYWELKAEFEKDSKSFEAFHKKGRFWEKAEADKALGKKAEKGRVVNVRRTERVLKKPFPFNTTQFLRAATAIGFSAGEAMNVAEGLYMKGFISYPRTDNSVYPKNLDLSEILNNLMHVKEFYSLAEKIFALGELKPSRGKETKDHPPIHPVTPVQKEKLSPREWKIYELVVRRFFATLARDAVTENLSVEIGLNSEPYVAKGQLIKEKGWKEFYPYSVLAEVILPPLKKGNEVKLVDLELQEKKTQPPARYSQGSLIKLMEQVNLGTKSTRSEILTKLYYRKYISGLKALEPNKIAFAVIDSLEKYSEKVVKPKMTADLEKEMDLIAAGKKSKEEVVKDSRNLLLEILDELVKNKDSIGKELRAAMRQDSIAGKCPAPNCGGMLLVRMSRNNKRFLGCSNYPKCTTTFPLPQKGSITFTGEECETCKMPMFKVVGRGFRYSMCINIDCESKKDWKKKTEKASSKQSKEPQS